MPAPIQSPAYDRLRAAMAQEPPPRKASGRRTALTLLAVPGLVLSLLALDAVLRHRDVVRADLHGAIAIGVPSLMGAIALVLLTTLIAISRGTVGLGERVTALQATALGIAPLSVIPMLMLAFAGAPAAASRSLLDPLGLPCFALATAVTVPSLWLLASSLRQSVVAAAGWRSAAVGAAAGAWAGLALLVHCPSVEAQHLLTGHLLPVALAPLFGVLLIRRYVQV
jgi:hypothetical protein